MKWNYRVVKRQLTEDEVSFDICEVYYDAEGKPTSYILDKNVLSQDSYTDLRWAYNEIAKAFEKPVLEIVDGKLVEF